MTESTAIERATPSPERSSAPSVVGIGASAGGIIALKSLFRELHFRPDLAFVVIQHLGPGSPGQLVQLVSRWSSLPALQVMSGERPKAGHIYVAGPEQVLLERGQFRTRLAVTGTHSLNAIDTFFESLAQDCGPRAIAVVLSGSGTDGAAGAVCVKRSGGIIIVQDPLNAMHSSMPRAVIGHGIADYILPAGEIVHQAALCAAPAHVRSDVCTSQAQDMTQALDSIVELVGKQAGFDLSGYKLTTVLWRLQQRMSTRRIRSFKGYVALLRDDPGELETLLHGIPIHLTEFFRDSPAWDALSDHVIEGLSRDRRRGEPIRIWTPGCATGEEAYSVAMLLSEQLRASGKPLDFQVFATDASAEIVARASRGVYSQEALRSLSPQRRVQFIEEADGAYRVKRDLRDKIVFATQDLLVDPPFTGLDLITCRNVLIYLDREAIQRVLSGLHCALRAGGYLFLGSGEPLLPGQNGFMPVSTLWRIYRKEGPAATREWSEAVRLCTEELDASREELQALNEELNASNDQLNLANQYLEQVNSRLNDKIGELQMQSRVLSSGEVTALFLDQELNVRWFTSAITDLFPLKLADVGRRITDLTQRFEDHNFITAVRGVMQTGTPDEAEVRNIEGRYFLRRIRPYLSDEKPGGGVAVTFTDITERTLAESELRRTEASIKAQKEAFQAALGGASLETSLDFLVRAAVEQMGAGAQCAFYLADAAGLELHHVNGLPGDGPLCWSFPIETAAAKVIGTFAIYHRQPRAPSSRDLELATLLTRAAALIISRHQSSELGARAETAMGLPSH